MTRLFLATFVSVLVVACATSPDSGPQASATISEEPSAAPRPTQIERMGFTVPIPQGWEEVKGENVVKLTGENGAAMANPNIMAVGEGASPFQQANTVIRYVSNMDMDPKDPAKCQATANAFAKGLKSTVDSANIITLPTAGETCQVSLSGEDNTERKTRITILPNPNNNYVMTCYYDGRDAAAAGTCDQTIQAFTFKAVAAPTPPPSMGAADGGTPAMNTATPDAGTAPTK